MAILAFQKPDKVVMLDSNDKFGKFEFRPLEPGFGVTIGNSLRPFFFFVVVGLYLFLSVNHCCCSLYFTYRYILRSDVLVYMIICMYI